jgi:hypothetical protein
VAGDWYSPYDGVTVSSPAELEVDHVMVLAEAWDSGAAEWSTARREAFANDLDEPASLIAVTAAANQAKADHDPAQWQPRHEDRSRYADAWVRVKVKWDLSADQAEVDALRGMLTAC